AAYPNPFNPETQVRYTMPAAGDVVFTIVNTNGQIVRRHAESITQAGAFHWLWNGRDTAGNAVASGVYFWQISARTVDGKQYFRNQKVTLMK
ncbi:MAG: T9SS C-terminal target domain-containing protein, partial [Calditrichaeota bacterium]